VLRQLKVLATVNEGRTRFGGISMLQKNFVGKTTGNAMVIHIAACLINHKIRKPKMVSTENATLSERLIQKS